MILYNGIKYIDFIDLLFSKLREHKPVKVKMFPHHSLFYCRAALENKFKRKFKLSEVKELIKDLPQTSPTSRDDIRKLLERHA